MKFTPNSGTAVDLTVKPDFSQVESDVAQISANERFALFVPEKRSFFLEGVDLFQTPIQAVYTRTITAPTWGARITGKAGGVRYTALVAGDDGGGSVVLPGVQGSSLAAQDFASTVFVARVKRDIGRSFISVLMTDREGRGSASYNRVLGPDFQWRPTATETITGQWLVSDTRTPNRPDLARGVDRPIDDLARRPTPVEPQHDAVRCVRGVQGLSVKASAPRRGSCRRSGTAKRRRMPDGRSDRPASHRRLRTFVNVIRQVDGSGTQIGRGVQPGVTMFTRWNGFMQFRYIDDDIRVGSRSIGRRQLGYAAQFSPSRLLSTVAVTGTTGQEIDFANARPATGTTLNLSATLNPTNHLNLLLNQDQSWVNVDDGLGASRQLFIARVSRIRATYTLTSRMFVRATVQYVSTEPGRRAVCAPHHRQVGHAQRPGAALVQIELAVGHVHRIRRRPDAVGAGPLRESRPPVLRQVRLRAPALAPSGT